jgi:hypothetical protein
MTATLANERLAQRRRRTLHIRKAVAGALVATFLAFFAVIYIQMAAGKDPALGASATKAIAVTAAPATSAPSESESESEPSEPAPSTSAPSTSAPAPVTSRQS